MCYTSWGIRAAGLCKRSGFCTQKSSLSFIVLSLNYPPAAHACICVCSTPLRESIVRLYVDTDRLPAYCSAEQIPCTQPANTDGYTIQNTHLNDLFRDSFSIDVVCADDMGYTGTAVATPCATEAGEYELSGCEGQAFAHQSRLLIHSSSPSNGPLPTPAAHACNSLCSKTLRQSIARTYVDAY
jgi:hypothetical protein